MQNINTLIPYHIYIYFILIKLFIYFSLYIYIYYILINLLLHIYFQYLTYSKYNNFRYNFIPMIIFSWNFLIGYFTFMQNNNTHIPYHTIPYHTMPYHIYVYFICILYIYKLYINKFIVSYLFSISNIQ